MSNNDWVRDLIHNINDSREVIEAGLIILGAIVAGLGLYLHFTEQKEKGV